MMAKKVASVFLCICFAMSSADVFAASVTTKKKLLPNDRAQSLKSKTVEQVEPVSKPSEVVAPAKSSNSKITITNDFSVTANSVSGDGKANSSLSEGTHMLVIGDGVRILV